MHRHGAGHGRHGPQRGPPQHGDGQTHQSRRPRATPGVSWPTMRPAATRCRSPSWSDCTATPGAAPEHLNAKTRRARRQKHKQTRIFLVFFVPSCLERTMTKPPSLVDQVNTYMAAADRRPGRRQLCHGHQQRPGRPGPDRRACPRSAARPGPAAAKCRLPGTPPASTNFIKRLRQQQGSPWAW